MNKTVLSACLLSALNVNITWATNASEIDACATVLDQLTAPNAVNPADLKQSKLQCQVEHLSATVEKLEQQLDLVLTDIIDIESKPGAEPSNSVHIGGYGELHYRNLDNAGEEFRELDFHRMVLFFSYDFNDRARFVSELEIEHIIASAGSRGAVELEQVYLEFDLSPDKTLQTGAILMPIGIINETHEPTTFYGVERPIVETAIIPTTWWSTGVNFTQRFDNGVRYDLMLSEGLKTDDPNSNANADPFDLRAGKQRGSFADAFDLAVTGRIRYTGRPGLELSAYAQYQPDLDQSAKESYADEATLLGGHVIYTYNKVSATALFTRWDLGGDQAAEAGRDVQQGAYVEVSWQPVQRWGAYVRQSAWTLEENVDSEQFDFGVNFYPYEGVVFKADMQFQNQDAGDSDGFSLAMGYSF